MNKNGFCQVRFLFDKVEVTFCKHNFFNTKL